MFVFTVLVLTDDARRRIEDDLCRTVVAFELDDPGLGKIGLEIENVAEVGSPPFVDRLIRIADDAQVAVDIGEMADQQVLRPVGILIFVDHDEAELAGVPGVN